MDSAAIELQKPSDELGSNAAASVVQRRLALFIKRINKLTDLAVDVHNWARAAEYRRTTGGWVALVCLPLASKSADLSGMDSPQGAVSETSGKSKW